MPRSRWWTSASRKPATSSLPSESGPNSEPRQSTANRDIMRRAHPKTYPLLNALLCGVLALLSLSPKAEAWWDEEWTIRKKITIDTAAIAQPVGASAVLVRLHDGNYQFLNAKEDGSDIRFVAE